MQLPHRARGHHQLQAVHGLPGRVLQRRRPDPEGDADRRRVRRDDHDARRERHRHRRARAAGARPRRDRPAATTATPGPSPLEAEATHRAIVLSHVAGNVPLYIVHMSAGDALNEVAAARHHGRNVFAETCPQYLWLTLEETLGQPGFEGAKWVCSTPVRSQGPRPALHRPDGPRPPGRPVEGPAHERAGRRQHRPLPVLLQGPEGARPRRLLQDPQRHRRRRAPHGAASTRVWSPASSASSAGSRPAAPRRRACSACTRRRASSPPAPTPTSWCGTPTRKTKIGINDKHHMNMDHSAWEGWVIDGKVDTVLSPRHGRRRERHLRRPQGPRPVRPAWAVAVPGLTPPDHAPGRPIRVSTRAHRSTHMQRISHWIDGKVVDGTSGRSGVVCEPGHGRAAGRGRPRLGRRGRSAVVAVAKAAFPAWRATNLSRAGRGDVPHARARRRQPQGDRLAAVEPSTARCSATRSARSPAASRTSSSPAACPTC